MSVQQRFDGFRPGFGVISDVAPEVNQFDASLDVAGFDTLFGEVVDEIVDFLGPFSSAGAQRLATPDTEVLFSGRFFTTPMAFDRSDGIVVGFFDFPSVDARQFPIRIAGEDRDISGSRITSADPAVMVLEMGLIHSLGSEMRRTGLSEVREREGFVDIGALSRGLEHPELVFVRQFRGLVESGPERVIGITGGMVLQPGANVWNAGDERDSSLALLSLNSDGQPVVVFREVTDGQIDEFTATETGVELQRDGCFVSGVLRSVEHIEDVGVPSEHISGIRHRIVVAGRRRGNPLDTIGIVVPARHGPSEDTERDAVIPIRFLVRSLSVDPGDDVFRRVARTQSLAETADLLGDDSIVPEKFEMSIFGVLGRTQEHSVGEVEKFLSVLVDDFIRVFDALAKRFDLLSWVRHIGASNGGFFILVALNLIVTSLHRLGLSGSKPFLYTPYRFTKGVAA